MTPSKADATALLARLRTEAEASGYLLNPDEEFLLDLMTGLLVNRARYGYLACPCREAEGDRAADLDIICPCDYRDPDLDDHGACYCALYVSEAVAAGREKLRPIPERRPSQDERRSKTIGARSGSAALRSAKPVWRCSVCGYLCARPEPPLKCPICKADKDRFDEL